MATVQLEPFNYNKFRGIREQNGVSYGGEISALNCQNVELVQTEIADETGIKTVAGNDTLYSIPSNFNIIGIFKSEQKDTENTDSFHTYFFIYAEDKTAEKGYLYYIDNNDTAVRVKDSEDNDIEFNVTGKCNGLTMTSTAYDVFIFTNGEDAYSICFTSDTSYGDNVKPINFTVSNNTKTYKQDRLGHDVKFLPMVVFNGFLVVATDYGVRASHQNNIYEWSENTGGAADVWDIDYSKKVTALYAYTGGLFIFTEDTTDFLTGSPNVTGNVLQNTAGVGCYNYQAIVKHDTYLFFYDNIQKNVYFIQNIDNGQTRPAGPVAKEIQSQFKNVLTFKMFSCIYNNRNEIWCLINDKIFIYDYFQQEWVERKHQKINSLVLIKNTIYTASANKVLAENTSSNFDGGYYPSVYQTTIINAGSNSNLKKQKTPLLLVLNNNYVNDFYVQLTVNGKAKTPKPIKKSSIQSGFYATTEYVGEDSENVPGTMKYGTAKYSSINPYSRLVVEISTPQTWYTLGIKIFTRTAGQGFYINSMELKNMKAKLKTKGR